MIGDIIALLNMIELISSKFLVILEDSICDFAFLQITLE